MAQKVQVLLVDDIDGGEATETVTFALDGTQYEMDLSDKNGKALRKVLGPYVEKARKVGRGARSRNGTPRTGPDPKVVRQWAQQNGVPVNPTGRIPAHVVQQFEAANS